MDSQQTVDQILKDHVPEELLKKVNKVIYGAEIEEIELPPMDKDLQCELKGYKLPRAKPEEMRAPRIVRVGIIQHGLVLPISDPIKAQRDEIHKKLVRYIEHAAASGVNIVCMQELWTMPMIFCTREKYPWTEFAENALTGPTTELMTKLALKHGIVIVSAILERDEKNCDIIWNTTVVINADGRVLGKQRKNHIPRNGDFNESTYYMEGNLGHPVFNTTYGKIGVVTCYGRHHPLNWLVYGLNGAEIVFNPSAIIAEQFETLWHVEARCAAISNSYFTCAINRVGTEVYPREFTSGDGKPPHRELGEFFGSSYVTAPNGVRTPSLNRSGDGLLIAELDLNLCRQVKDSWNFPMTRRLDLYSKRLVEAAEPDFEPQIVN
ncbi:beta-ureidopropionase-like [Trichogramma pretiosum]|uniref:beta-ureidopropionase-like n=1 Tax=Trichogramma pretiosum TaxID=7493 RepID=UPI0006C95784|nr:beta-ureidopropionase-like [Trichogramma pretiosum]